MSTAFDPTRIPQAGSVPEQYTSSGESRPPYAVVDGVHLRTATTADLAAMAALQIHELPMGLFPQLGGAFVARWHRAFLDSPNAVGLVAVRRSADGQEAVVGFLIGSTDRTAFRREVLSRHRAALVVRGAGAMLARPAVLLRFLRTRLRPYLGRMVLTGLRGDSGGSDLGRVQADPVGDLTAIAVAPTERRGGVGRRLIETYLARCAALGVLRVELITASASQAAAAFYQCTGWALLARDRTRDGIPVERFGRHPRSAEGSR